MEWMRRSMHSVQSKYSKTHDHKQILRRFRLGLCGMYRSVICAQWRPSSSLSTVSTSILVVYNKCSSSSETTTHTLSEFGPDPLLPRHNGQSTTLRCSPQVKAQFASNMWACWLHTFINRLGCTRPFRSNGLRSVSGGSVVIGSVQFSSSTSLIRSLRVIRITASWRYGFHGCRCRSLCRSRCWLL